VNLYQDLFTRASQAGQDEDLTDILTNLLACASNQDAKSIQAVDRLVESTQGKLDRTYEFYFNLSQVQMKQQLHGLAFKSLLQSFEQARQDEHHTDDAVRFKIQELHALNTFCKQFSAIDYNVGG
jgi:hypothetical protein